MTLLPIITGVGLSTLTAFLTNALPKKGDPTEVKVDKIRNLGIASLVGIAAIGLAFIVAQQQQEVPPEFIQPETLEVAVF